MYGMLYPTNELLYSQRILYPLLYNVLLIYLCFCVCNCSSCRGITSLCVLQITRIPFLSVTRELRATHKLWGAPSFYQDTLVDSMRREHAGGGTDEEWNQTQVTEVGKSGCEKQEQQAWKREQRMMIQLYRLPTRTPKKTT